MAFTNNYSTSFRWWDFIFGTDTKYREYKKKVRAAKLAMQNATKEQLEAAEKQVLDQYEKEGLRAEAEAEASSLFGARKTKDQ
jgi:methylsterol monooxygenase